jgi:hypothetical protein
MGFVDVVSRNAVLVAAACALPGVFAVVEARLSVQVLVAPVAEPIDIRESSAHCCISLWLVIFAEPIEGVLLAAMAAVGVGIRVVAVLPRESDFST